MSATEESLLKTQEFIEAAQEIIARTKDLMAALDKLAGKDLAGKQADPAQLAQQARLQEEMNTLIQRYFPESLGASFKQNSKAGPISSQNSGGARPGRFRTRI